jgi:CRISPR-associated protein Csa3
MPTTAFVFIGHSKDRLIESIRSMRSDPVTTIVLVTGEQDSSGEEKSRGIAEELERDLAPVFDVVSARIDKRDVIHAAQQIIGMIRGLQEKGDDVILNMSGSLRTFSIAGYIAGCITGSKMITVIPEYDNNEQEIGIEEVIELPVLPLHVPGDAQRAILAAISDGVASLDELVIKLNPRMKKSSDAFSKERSRLSHHLKNLGELGFVTKEKSGKNVGVTLTGLGKMMLADGRKKK